MATTMSYQYDDPLIERQSLCLPGMAPGIAMHAGESDFKAKLDAVFRNGENNANEKLVALKAELRLLDTEAFWNRLMEGLAEICHAQFGFVSKRILVDDHNTAIEMPPIGEVGSCLMGVALYYNNGKDLRNMSRDYKYYAWGAPCSNMKHDKVFLVPDGLSTFITDNPNQLPFECDGYLGIPLFADGKCFAHFGLMWTTEGLEKKKNLSWGYIEMVMHSLEDMITDKLVAGRGFAKVNKEDPRRLAEAPDVTSKVVPQESVTPAQSLKPYAQSLSHELRTPMQGVVGMLDVIYATVQEQLEEQSGGKLLNIFRSLKDNIETVQDSSKRAIEAADNVVYAYDLNMQVPETPGHEMESSAVGPQASYFDTRPKMVEGSNIVNPFKRRRSSPNTWNSGNPNKTRIAEETALQSTAEAVQSPLSPFAKPSSIRFKSPRKHTPTSGSIFDPDRFEFPRPSSINPADMDLALATGVRQCNIRELIPVIIHDALRVGGRPDSAIAEMIPLGERIEVRTRSSNGHASQKTVEWQVDPDVPDIVGMDERDLSKLISSVLLNAIKFTEDGTIAMLAKLHPNKRYILITIADTGSGIPEGFQPELFKAFAKEDHSITRAKEGLGLGLLVAKGLARRTGGDIVLTRSSTDSHDHGTEFEIRVPIDQSELSSRSSTPFSNNSERHISKTTPSILQKPVFRENMSPPTPPRLESPASTPVPHFSSIHKLVSVAASEEKLAPSRRLSATPKLVSNKLENWDRKLSEKYPLNFLVAEDNKINRKLLVNMLGKFGYKNIHEAFDGREAVRIVDSLLTETKNGMRLNSGEKTSPIDVILMDLWMPVMDGYEATEKILAMYRDGQLGPPPIVLAVSADVTDQAVDRATRTGMQGYMTKPYKLMDVQRLIMEFCSPVIPHQR